MEDVLGEKFKKVPKQSEIMKELFEELEREEEKQHPMRGRRMLLC